MTHFTDTSIFQDALEFAADGTRYRLTIDRAIDFASVHRFENDKFVSIGGMFFDTLEPTELYNSVSMQNLIKQADFEREMQ